MAMFGLPRSVGRDSGDVVRGNVGQSGTSATKQEGRIQVVYPLVKPPGDVKTDFDIIASLLDAAASMTVGSSASVFGEIKKQVPSYAGREISANNTKGVMVKASDKRLSGAGDKPEPGVPFKT